MRLTDIASSALFVDNGNLSALPQTQNQIQVDGNARQGLASLWVGTIVILISKHFLRFNIESEPLVPSCWQHKGHPPLTRGLRKTATYRWASD